MVADEILKMKKKLNYYLFVSRDGAHCLGLIRGPIIAQNGSKDAE